MDMNKKDFEAIGRALQQQGKNGKITEKCPRCGNKLLYTQIGNSCEVRCATDGCISEAFRGV